jgi:hypothetical protein
VILERLAEVAVEEVRQVTPVLNGDRLVEPVPLLERGDRGGIAGSLLAEVGRDGVARNELCERERDERDPEGEQDERSRASEDEAEEGRTRETQAGG